MNSWLASLDSCLRAQVPDLPGPEPDEAQLANLQKGLSKPLPTPFLEFLRWLPGGLGVEFHWELPNSVGGQMADLSQMHNLNNVWKRPSPAGTRNWWSPLWLPVLDCGAGNFFCLDLEGSLGNPAGSLLQFSHGQPERPVYFPDFQSWLRWLSLALQQGMGRVFQEDQKLDIVINRKATKLHTDLFPRYPMKCAAEVIGLGQLDQTLHVARKQGLKLGPNCCALPASLTPEGLENTLKNSFVREDGPDGECVRVILLCEVASRMWSLYANLRITHEGVFCDSLVSLPENAADSVRSALLLHGQGDASAASRRLSEAAFGCFQAGLGGEAMAILGRSLEMDPSNQVAARSKAALEAKQVKMNEVRLRPLLQHLAG